VEEKKQQRRALRRNSSMKKIPTLFIRDQFTLAPLVIVEPIELTFDGIRDYLAIHPIEGIVWRDQRSNIDNPNFAKIKRRDFGFPWPVKKSRILG
jgi:hypothetical protein